MIAADRLVVTDRYEKWQSIARGRQPRASSKVLRRSTATATVALVHRVALMVCDERSLKCLLRVPLAEVVGNKL